MTRKEVEEIRNIVLDLHSIPEIHILGGMKVFDFIGEVMGFSSGGTEALCYYYDLIFSSDNDEKKIVREVLSRDSKAVQDYKNGKKSAIGSIIGMVMKQNKSLNPSVVKQKIEEFFV